MTGGSVVSTHAVGEMPDAKLELSANRHGKAARVTTGERLDIERITSSSERGGWKRVGNDNALAAYSTSCPVLK